MLTEMTQLALLTAWNARRRVNESAHLNSVGNLIPPTNRPCTLDRRRGRACAWVGWRSGLKYNASEG